jgi:aminomuconate-semialdehyde/2-hydroxymuconate-6-semialdehyde dehydrogenase
MQTLKNYIGGEYAAPIRGRYLDSVNPATGEIICKIPDSDAADINFAVDAAKAAFPQWSRTSAQERSRLLNRIADLLEKRTEEFARAESIDQGKPLWLARDIEVPRAVKNFRHFASQLTHQTLPAYGLDDKGINYTQRSPLGVAGLISPWNLPLYLITWKIAPALAAGNTAVCKPSELTSLTASKLGEIFTEAGLPAGVCNIVMGRGSEAGAALIAHKDVPLISFTGGTETAKTISAIASPLFKKLSLELGGKNPNIIFADADLKNCIPTTVRSSFQNQGEICLCGSRILVEESIYDKFLEKFIAATRDWNVGDPLDPATKMGALVSEDHMKKVLNYIALAKQEGGKIAFGGERLKLQAPFDRGFFVSPTIITGLAPSCRVMQEEIFGPVVTITPFKSMDEAIEIANGVRYGLSASIWTQDISRAHTVAHRIEAGSVWVNTWMQRDLRVPFGGVKDSGIGREGGEFSMDFYTEWKTICVNFGNG